MGVGAFEDLICWQKARELAGMVYKPTRSGAWTSDLSLAGQMQRAAISIMANIAEGHERGSARDFARFLSMAKGSCAELRSHLHIASDIGHIESSVASTLLERTFEVSRIIGGLRASVLRRAGDRKVST